MKRPTLKTYRRTFQLFVAISFIIIPILNRTDYSYVYGIGLNSTQKPKEAITFLESALKNHPYVPGSHLRLE